MNEYSQLAYCYTRTAADYIDGDKVLEYVESGQKDDYYQKVMEFLTITRNQSGLQYYYVFVPYEDDLVYVWDAGTLEEGACPLGYREDYMDGGKEAVEKIFCSNPSEDISVTYDDVYGYIASAYSPIFDSSGQPVAVAGVDLSMMGIQQNLWQFIFIILVSIVLVTGVTLFIFFTFIQKNIVSPIALLNDAAKNMVDNLEQEKICQIDIYTKDEIGELATSFCQMDEEVRRYIQSLSLVTAEKERIGAELSVATQIQADMLPNIFPAFPDRPEFTVYADMNPAKEVGGDFYDFFLIDDTHLALVIADVSGKGVPAALFMVISKTLIKNQTLTGQSPKDVLMIVNNQLCENNQAQMFVTVWLGILDLATGKLVAANAGHEYPALRQANGDFQLYKDKHGFVLAGMEQTKYREYELQLSPGDTLFVYTDGVPEATDETEQLYGTARMLRALNAPGNNSPEELVKRVQKDMDSFVGDATQFDDITMLVMTYHGLQGKHENKKSIILPAVRENWDRVSEFLETALDEKQFPIKSKMKLLIAVEELYVNITRYSYTGNIGNAEIQLEFLSDPERARVTLIDQGVPYNPLQKSDPDTTLSADDREIGGLGIHMVKKSMDHLLYEYKDGNNIMVIEKNFA